MLLSPTDLVIADAMGAIALAGVMGGEESGVVDETTEVLLESAFFQPSSVRRSARLHSLHSESSHRFERGTDPLGVLVAPRSVPHSLSRNWLVARAKNS